MSLRRTPELLAFLSHSIAEAAGDPQGEAEATRRFLEGASASQRELVVAQAQEVLDNADFPILDELGAEANRWFGDADEARDWLGGIVAMLQEDAADGGDASHALVVKDSNGAVLAEGDSVQVIRDLKVKGGSSDLKRGTLIKKIHLIDDAEAIECRVDGSTLVLKTCFLKKA